jgi:hypothetical protein
MKRLLLLILVYMLFSNPLRAQDAVSKAKQFVDLLTDAQKNTTLFSFDDSERYNFHFVPLARKGITFNEMTQQQKEAAIALLKSCLSENTYQRSTEIRQLEVLLKSIEKRTEEDHYRDSGNYHFSIFGIPTNHTIWGWRFEGHHQTFNFSFDKQTLISGTPGFMGTNPAIVLDGPVKGKQILKAESDAGFQLLHALTETQKQKAIIDTVAFKDIVSFDKRNAILTNHVGIYYAELNDQQKKLLLDLVKVYINRYTKIFANDFLNEVIKDDLNKLQFAWAGAREEALGKGTYYRIQGPGILIEYDNTQNNANHVHSVIRNLSHDFGGDILLEHYRNSH